MEALIDNGTAHVDEDGNIVIMAEGGDEEGGETTTTEAQTTASGDGAAASQESAEPAAEQTSGLDVSKPLPGLLLIGCSDIWSADTDAAS